MKSGSKLSWCFLRLNVNAFETEVNDSKRVIITSTVVIFNGGLTYFSEIRKLTANVEATLLGVLIPLCQRNSGRLEEVDREV